jgi:hypothetical protein
VFLIKWRIKLKKYVLLAFVLLSFNANAEEKYMKLDSEVGGGYLTLQESECEIVVGKKDYQYKAVIEIGSGETRQACWKRSEAHWNDHFESRVLVLEEMVLEDGKLFYPQHSFGQYYFTPTKE